MLTILIIDDEFGGRNFLEKILLMLFTDVEIVGKAATLQEATDIIQSKHPQLVFLDVMLNTENGFALFERLDKIDFETVFTTAHNEFAIKAFKFNALDYLLKPIDIDELERVVNKAKKKLLAKENTSPDMIRQAAESFKFPDKPLNKLSIPTTTGFLLLPVEDILYCEAFGNYTNFHLASNKKVTSSYTLKEYEDMLTTQHFFRAHKSFLVNLAHVSRYIKGEGGTLVMMNGAEIEVSRRNKEALLKILKAYPFT